MADYTSTSNDFLELFKNNEIIDLERSEKIQLDTTNGVCTFNAVAGDDEVIVKTFITDGNGGSFGDRDFADIFYKNYYYGTKSSKIEAKFTSLSGEGDCTLKIFGGSSKTGMDELASKTITLTPGVQPTITLSTESDYQYYKFYILENRYTGAIELADSLSAPFEQGDNVFLYIPKIEVSQTFPEKSGKQVFETKTVEKAALAVGENADIIFKNPNYGTANNKVKAEFTSLSTMGNCQLKIFGSNDKSAWTHIISTAAAGNGTTFTPAIETESSTDYKYYRFYIENTSGSIALCNFPQAPFEVGTSSGGTAKVKVTLTTTTAAPTEVVNPEYSLVTNGSSFGNGEIGKIGFENPHYGQSCTKIRAEFNSLEGVGNALIDVYGSNNKTSWTYLNSQEWENYSYVEPTQPIVEINNPIYKYYKFEICERHLVGSMSLTDFATGNFFEISPFIPAIKVTVFGTFTGGTTTPAPTGPSAPAATNPTYTIRNLGAGAFWGGEWREIGFENPYYGQTCSKIKAVFSCLTTEGYNSTMKIFGANDRNDNDWVLLESLDKLRWGADQVTDVPYIETTKTSYRYYKFYIQEIAAVGCMACAGEITENFFEVSNPFGAPAVSVTVYGTFAAVTPSSPQQETISTFESTSGKGYLAHGEHSEFIFTNPNYGSASDLDIKFISITPGGLYEYTILGSNDKTTWSYISNGQRGSDGIYDSISLEIDDVANKDYKYYKFYIKNNSQEIGVNGKLALATGYSAPFEIVDATYGMPQVVVTLKKIGASNVQVTSSEYYTSSVSHSERSIAYPDYADIVLINPYYGTSSSNIKCDFIPLTNEGSCDMKIYGSDDKNIWDLIKASSATGTGTNPIVPTIETGKSTNYKFYRFEIYNKATVGDFAAITSVPNSQFERGKWQVDLPQVKIKMFGSFSGQITEKEYSTVQSTEKFWYGDIVDIIYVNPYYGTSLNKIRADFVSASTAGACRIKAYGSNTSTTTAGSWTLIDTVNPQATSGYKPYIELYPYYYDYKYYRFEIEDMHTASMGHRLCSNITSDFRWGTKNAIGSPQIKVTLYGSLGSVGAATNPSFNTVKNDAVLPFNETADIIFKNPRYGVALDKIKAEFSSLLGVEACEVSIYGSNIKEYNSWNLLKTLSLSGNTSTPLYTPMIEHIGSTNYQYYRFTIKENRTADGSIECAYGYHAPFEAGHIASRYAPKIKVTITGAASQNVVMPVDGVYCSKPFLVGENGNEYIFLLHPNAPVGAYFKTEISSDGSNFKESKTIYRNKKTVYDNAIYYEDCFEFPKAGTASSQLSLKVTGSRLVSGDDLRLKAILAKPNEDGTNLPSEKISPYKAQAVGSFPAYGILETPEYLGGPLFQKYVCRDQEWYWKDYGKLDKPVPQSYVKPLTFDATTSAGKWIYCNYPEQLGKFSFTGNYVPFANRGYYINRQWCKGTFEIFFSFSAWKNYSDYDIVVELANDYPFHINVRKTHEGFAKEAIPAEGQAADNVDINRDMWNQYFEKKESNSRQRHGEETPPGPREYEVIANRLVATEIFRRRIKGAPTIIKRNENTGKDEEYAQAGTTGAYSGVIRVEIDHPTADLDVLVYAIERNADGTLTQKKASLASFPYPCPWPLTADESIAMNKVVEENDRQKEEWRWKAHNKAYSGITDRFKNTIENLTIRTSTLLQKNYYLYTHGPLVDGVVNNKNVNEHPPITLCCKDSQGQNYVASPNSRPPLHNVGNWCLHNEIKLTLENDSIDEQQIIELCYAGPNKKGTGAMAIVRDNKKNATRFIPSIEGSSFIWFRKKLLPGETATFDFDFILGTNATGPICHMMRIVKEPMLLANREPEAGRENWVRLTAVAGEENVYKMEYADNAVYEGTPLTKEVIDNEIRFIYGQGNTGEIRSFAKPVSNEGWLRCDGSMIRQAEYKTLFDFMNYEKNFEKPQQLSESNYTIAEPIKAFDMIVGGIPASGYGAYRVNQAKDGITQFSPNGNAFLNGIFNAGRNRMMFTIPNSSNVAIAGSNMMTYETANTGVLASYTKRLAYGEIDGINCTVIYSPGIAAANSSAFSPNNGTYNWSIHDSTPFGSIGKLHYIGGRWLGIPIIGSSSISPGIYEFSRLNTLNPMRTQVLSGFTVTDIVYDEVSKYFYFTATSPDVAVYRWNGTGAPQRIALTPIQCNTIGLFNDGSGDAAIPIAGGITGAVYMYNGTSNMQKIAEVRGEVKSLLQNGSDIYISTTQLYRMKVLKTTNMFALPEAPKGLPNTYIKA